MSNKEKIIGFIGLGNMGRGMAKNLVKKGYNLVVNDINPNPVKELAEMGAKSAANPKETSAMSDIVLTVLPGPSEVSEVMFGPDGVLEGIRNGGVIFDMTTSDPALIRKVGEEAREKSVTVLDAPISGGQMRAEEGTLAIMVGGDKEVFERHRDIMEAMGTGIFHVGGLGSGSVVKITLNAIQAIHMASIGEAFVAGIKAGVEAKSIFQVLSKSSGTSWLIENMLPFPGIVPNSPADRDFKPGFRMVLMSKDLRLMEAMAKEYGAPIFITALVRQLYEAAIFKGMGEKDWTAVCKLYQEF